MHSNQKIKAMLKKFYDPTPKRWRKLGDALLGISLLGIPAVEGQACGTPVIVSDFSAQPELIGPHSKAVPVQRVWGRHPDKLAAMKAVEVKEYPVNKNGERAARHHLFYPRLISLGRRSCPSVPLASA